MNRIALQYAQMPMVANVPVGRRDWTKVHCPRCRLHCWYTPLIRQVIEDEQRRKLPRRTIAVCTQCALGGASRSHWQPEPGQPLQPVTEDPCLDP